MGRSLRWLLVGGGVLLGVLVLGVGTFIALARARTDRLENALEPFYTDPVPLPTGQPGDILRQEALDAPAGVRMWRVLYRSTRITGEAVPISGLIAVPDVAPPAGGFPVVVLAHGTVGTARICATSLEPFRPSQVLPTFLTPQKKADTYFNYHIKPFTDAGWAVTSTDYRGLGTVGPSPFLVGADEAASVLDSARAIRRFPGLTLSDQNVIWGQSQGGHAAAFAAQQAGRYAPEVNVIGVVLGAPAAELTVIADEIAATTGKSPITGIFITIARAWAATYPELRVETVLTTRAIKQMGVVDRACIADVLLTYAFRPVPEYVKTDDIRSGAWGARLRENTAAAARLAAPFHVFQGGADIVITPAATEAYVRRLCASGNTVDMKTYPGLGHIDAILPSMPDTVAWMADRLTGKPAPQGC